MSNRRTAHRLRVIARRRWRGMALCERDRWLGFTSLAALSWLAAVGILHASGQLPVSPGWALWPLGLTCGLILAGVGWRWRDGRSLHCAGCNQQVPPVGARPERCPECGRDWIAPRGVRRGRARRTAWMIAAGAGLLTLCLAMAGNLVLEAAAPSLKWKSAPLGVLRHAVADPRTLVTEAQWAALSQRPLPPRQLAGFVEALLDRRRAGGMMNVAMVNWIEAMLAGPVGRPDLRDRYFQECAEARLFVPQRIVAGEPFQVTLHVDRRCWASPGVTLEAWVTGICLDGDRRPVIGLHRRIGGSGFQRRSTAEKSYKWTIPAAPDVGDDCEVVVRLLYIAWPSGRWDGRGAEREVEGVLIHPQAAYVGTIHLRRSIKLVPSE